MHIDRVHGSFDMLFPIWYAPTPLPYPTLRFTSTKPAAVDLRDRNSGRVWNPADKISLCHIILGQKVSEQSLEGCRLLHHLCNLTSKGYENIDFYWKLKGGSLTEKSCRVKLKLKMATRITNRAAVDRTLDLLKLSSNFLRGFTTTPSFLSSQNPSASSSESKKPKRKKKKNLFEVAQFLPNWGIGYHMAKTHWIGVSYEITKINLYKDGKHGKAWGVVHKSGLPAADAPKKISGVHKRCWRYIRDAGQIGLKFMENLDSKKPSKEDLKLEVHT